MANEYALGYMPPRAVERTLLAVAVYVALLLMIFVRLDAFSPPPAVAHFGGVPEVSRGDLMRQVLYLGIAAMTGLVALQRYGLQMARAVPPSIALLLIWCLASALWAPQPGVVIRRAVLEIIIVVSLLLSVQTLGAHRAFQVWRVLLGLILLVNIASIPLVANARHGGDEIDTALIGNWRGLYGHKNIAGSVSAMTVIVYLFARIGRHNWIGIGVAAAAFGFLLMTHSKSSLGFLLIALMAGLAYRLSWRDGLSRAMLVTAVALLLVLLGGAALLSSDSLMRLLSDPAEFTGRSAIWAAELAYIADHPLFGHGFGTFADSGSLSPLNGYVSGWVNQVSHGHNGYLQVLVTIGGIGFILAMTGLVITPLRRFWALDQDGDGFKAMLFALFTFQILHNVMESDFLEGDGVTWSSLVLVIGALNNLHRERSLTSR